MAKKRKKQAPLQREYVKQRNRLKQAIRRAEKRGYIFDENVIPKQPKTITKKSVERLQKIKPKDLYEKANYIDTTTGEIITGKEGRQLERKESARKAKQTRKRKQERSSPYTPPVEAYYPRFSEMVISNYKAHIRQFNDVAYEKLSSWVDSLIAKFGEDDVATMLQEGAENGYIVTYQIVYSMDKLTEYIANMLDYLPEVGDIMKEDIVDAFEAMEDWESPQ